MFMSSTYVYASRQVEAALLQKSFPHSVVPDTEDDPVSQQTVLQAIAEMARFLKNFECGNVGIDCFFAHGGVNLLPYSLNGTRSVMSMLTITTLNGTRQCELNDFVFIH